MIRAVRMGIELPEVVSRDEARLQLGLGKQIVMASFGLVSPEKRISIALRCLKRMLDEDVDVRYLAGRGTVAHYNGAGRPSNWAWPSAYFSTERVSESDFRLYASAADICLNLRYPSAGRPLPHCLRLLAAGRAVMVTDQMRELDYPDTVVARTSLDGDETVSSVT